MLLSKIIDKINSIYLYYLCNLLFMSFPFLLSLFLSFLLCCCFKSCLSASLLSEQRQKRRTEVRRRGAQNILEEEEALSLLCPLSIMAFFVFSVLTVIKWPSWIENNFFLLNLEIKVFGKSVFLLFIYSSDHRIVWVDALASAFIVIDLMFFCPSLYSIFRKVIYQALREFLQI